MRILFLTGRFPYPPIRGDQALPYNQIKQLSTRHSVTLLSLFERASELEAIKELSPYCERIETVLLPSWRPYLNVLLGSYRRVPLQVQYYWVPEFDKKLTQLVVQKRFDIAHVVLSRLAPYGDRLPGVPKILDMIDALSLNMQRRSESESIWRSWFFAEEARRMRRFELEVCRTYDRVLVVSETDRDHIGADNVTVVPAGVDMEELPSVARYSDPTVLFTGNLGYPPNQDAVRFLICDILPLLRLVRPDVRIKIVGANPPADLMRLAKVYPEVEIVGFVPDLKPFFLRAHVAVCPLRTGGAGQHRKVIEAMACGVPVIASPLITGIAARPDKEILRAANASEFVAQIRLVLEKPDIARQLSWNARRLVSEKYTWDRSVALLENVYAEVSGASVVAPPGDLEKAMNAKSKS